MATQHFRPYKGGLIHGGTDFDSNPHGHNVEYSIDGLRFSGTMVHGEEHGKGTIVWPDGHSFEGTFDHGTTVRGKVRNPQGNLIYEGDYHVYYTFHGSGTQYYADGSMYIGDFKMGTRHGRGIMTYSNNDSYDGNWTKGLRDGIGKYRFSSNGDVLSGHWVKDKNKIFSIVEQGDKALDDLQILQDTVTPMLLSIDRWQSVCDKLKIVAKEAGADASVVQAIMDEAVAANANAE